MSEAIRKLDCGCVYEVEISQYGFLNNVSVVSQCDEHSVYKKTKNMQEEIEKLLSSVEFLQKHRDQLQKHNQTLIEKIQLLQIENIKFEQDVAHYKEENEYLQTENKRINSDIKSVNLLRAEYDDLANMYEKDTENLRNKISCLIVALKKLGNRDNYIVSNEDGRILFSEDNEWFYHPSEIAQEVLEKIK